MNPEGNPEFCFVAAWGADINSRFRRVAPGIKIRVVAGLLPGYKFGFLPAFLTLSKRSRLVTPVTRPLESGRLGDRAWSLGLGGGARPPDFKWLPVVALPAVAGRAGRWCSTAGFQMTAGGRVAVWAWLDGPLASDRRISNDSRRSRLRPTVRPRPPRQTHRPPDFK